MLGIPAMVQRHTGHNASGSQEVDTMYRDILRILLYYDIWHYPLTARELYTFLPVNSIGFSEFCTQLDAACSTGYVFEHGGYFFVKGKTPAVVQIRASGERHARRLWKAARLASGIIRRFPFVRGVFVSGDLSKNATHPESDVDFFVLTEPGRLWITRTMLILFKKIFLLNSKKFFCINYLVATDHLTFDDRNIFTATEIAQLKPMVNSSLFYRYLAANEWIKNFFPNFDVSTLTLPAAENTPSRVQQLLEWPFRFVDADTLDCWLREKMEVLWKRRYPALDDATRKVIFRCDRGESRAYVGNFQEKILALYHRKLVEFGLEK